MIDANDGSDYCADAYAIGLADRGAYCDDLLNIDESKMKSQNSRGCV